MDFKSLLSLAKDNQSYNLKKLERDKLLKSKADKNQVSDNAVKAFLAKKEKEAKAKREAEIRARQERILSKIDGPGKKENSKKAAPSTNQNPTKAHLQKRREEIPKGSVKSDKQVKQADTFRSVNSRKGAQPSKAVPDRKVVEKGKSCDVRDIKNGKLQGRDRDNGNVGHDRTNNADSSKQGKKGAKSNQSAIAKKPGLSFTELMSMAKQQANRSVPLQKPLVKKEPKKKEQESQNSKNFDYERYEYEKLMAKKKAKARAAGARQEESMPQMSKESSLRGKRPPRAESPDRKNSMHRQQPRDSRQSREPPPTRSDKCTLVTTTIGNYDPKSSRGQQKAGFKRPIPPGNMESKRPRMNPGRNRLKDIDMELERERRELEKKRMMFHNKYGGKNMEEDEYDDYGGYDDYEDEDDMDDFIDDSEAGLDVSKEIRKIFGYDRRRYDDDDDEDLGSMEASYSQIVQEEARSARIAKLEDDIERLREIKELQKEKKKGR